jgi:hypothetical protein
MEFRRIVDMAFLTGVNQISTYIHWEAYPAEVYRALNEYVGRLAVMLRGACNATNLAMYYPIETFQAQYTPSAEMWGEHAWLHLQGVLQKTQQDITIALLEHGLDFNYLDGEAVLAAPVEGGCLRVGDHAYSTLIMPQVELLPLNVLRKLQSFERNGGRVLWVNGLPRLGDSAREHELVREAVHGARVLTPDAVRHTTGRPYPEDFGLTFDDVPASGFFAARYRRGPIRLYLLVNNADAVITPTVNGQGRVRLYDPVDGRILPGALPLALQIEPCSALMLIEQGP